MGTKLGRRKKFAIPTTETDDSMTSQKKWNSNNNNYNYNKNNIINNNEVVTELGYE